MEQINPRELEAFLLAKEAEEANRSISQSDGIRIMQSQPDAEGFYIDSYQAQADAYNQARLQQQAMEAQYAQQNLYAKAQRTMDAFDRLSMDMGNPQYRVVTEGQRTTVDGNGNIIHY